MNQDTFKSKKWGMLSFFPIKAKDESKRCRHCCLYNDIEECCQAPCKPNQREDGRTGYFSVHQMPNEKGETK